jgi:glucosyl-3-phosphoglycerate phosphatase
MPERLLIVRHGESTWNAEERLQGQLDPPLSELGREQAAALGRAVDLTGFPSERILCSDLARARETAALLGVRPGRFERRWREIDIGAWGGRPAAEVDAEVSGLTNWRGGPVTAPDGESWAAFAERVAGAFDELAAAGGSWLVISHGGCVRAATAHVTGADHLRLGSPGNASLTSFELGDPGRLLSYGWVSRNGAVTGNY